MSGTRAKFQLIDEPAGVAPEPTPTDVVAQANTRMLLLALSALSKRALTGISAGFTLCLVASAWWLWDSVLPNPTTPQLIGLGGYALFCVVIDVVRRKN